MTSHPFISVVLPIRNEGSHIRTVLQAILDQDYPHHRFEVLIADGLSEDNTRAEIADLLQNKDEHPQVTLIDNPGQIVPTGLNAAIRMAKGEIIVRIDGHAIMSPDYLRASLEALQQTGADNVGGPIDCIGRDWMSSAIALATSKPFGVGNSAFRTSNRARYVDTVPFGAWRRELFQKIGLFNEHFVRHQDYEFNHRIRASGGKVYLTPAIKSKYFVRANPTKLMRQYFQYGLWKAKMLKIFPGSVKFRHAVPPLFVLALLVLSAVAILKPGMALWLWGLLAVYGTFLLTATVLSCHPKHWRFAPILPILFATLHLSWGSGFWLGLPRSLPPNFDKLPEPLDGLPRSEAIAGDV